MAIKDRRAIYVVTALFLASVLVLGVLHGCKQEAPQPTDSASPNDANATKAAWAASTEPAPTLFREPRASLQNIIKAAQWTAVLEEWWGKPMPDLALTDIEGNTHKLSDYRGKNIVVVNWATWCGPCRLEVPHLKELRNAFSKDKLAILAVSKEPTAIVKKFADEQGINYTVLPNAGSLPTPFDKEEFIPNSFFIDTQGKLKLAVRGIVPTADSKAIIQAE